MCDQQQLIRLSPGDDPETRPEYKNLVYHLSPSAYSCVSLTHSLNQSINAFISETNPEQTEEAVYDFYMTIALLPA